MFIDIWMHWFWITAVYVKGFLFLTVHAVSLSEAQLLNDTLAPPTPPPPYDKNHSSQTDRPRILSPTPPQQHPQSPHTVPYLSTSLTLHDDPTPHESTPPRPDDASPTYIASTSDMPDTFNGGTLDAVQYPLKKFTKYTHPKYIRPRAKPKISDDAPDDAKSDAPKIPHEKLALTTPHGFPPFPTPELDNPSASTPEAPSTDAPDATPATVPDDNDPKDLTLSPLLPPTDDRKHLDVLHNDTLVIESKVDDTLTYTTVEPFFTKNRVAAATSAHNYDVDQSDLNPGSITAIILGILVVFSLFGAVSFVLYRRRYLNKPEVLHDKCSNLDSSGYIDDTSLRENSEEMYSLDNDSFLNSLEAMTIQNYWTESVKHTKL